MRALENWHCRVYALKTHTRVITNITPLETPAAVAVASVIAMLIIK